MNRSVRAQAEPYIHMDIAVTAARLDQFASARPEVQLATLAALREREADNGATELAVVGVAAAVLIALFIPPIGLTDFSSVTNVWEVAGRMAGKAVVAFIVVALVTFGAREWIRRDRRRELASVWLRAYEDMLVRAAADASPQPRRRELFNLFRVRRAD